MARNLLVEQYADYGQQSVLAPPWFDGQSKAVLQWSQKDEAPPDVHGLALGLELPDPAPSSANHLWRWGIDLGVGGARAHFEIDAVGLQQICIPASAVGVSLINRAASTTVAYVAPTYNVTALAYLSKGTTATRAAVLTEWFEIGPAPASVTLRVPNGAVGWKLLGNGVTAATDSPFVAALSFDFFVLANFRDIFTGDQLLPTHVTDSFIPIVGGAKAVGLDNIGANTLRGAIQWSIDF